MKAYFLRILPKLVCNSSEDNLERRRIPLNKKLKEPRKLMNSYLAVEYHFVNRSNSTKFLNSQAPDNT